MTLLKRLIAYYRGQPPLRSVQHHVALYVVVMLVLIGLRFLTPWPAPVFWPALVWGFIVAIHFFIVRSLNVDDAWADERADDIRRNAYDFQHIREIYGEPKTLEALARERRKKQQEQQSDD